MTSVLVDTSVIVKWFHSTGEPDLAEARALRDATVSGDLDARVIDLCLYELGNVLSRSLRWNASDVADQLDDLVVICGAPLAMTAPWLRDAASIAHSHALTFYDASWAAAARALGVLLVSADALLLDSGLAVPAGAARELLGLSPPSDS